jgi:hypothetical protein
MVPLAIFSSLTQYAERGLLNVAHLGLASAQVVNYEGAVTCSEPRNLLPRRSILASAI